MLADRMESEFPALARKLREDYAEPEKRGVNPKRWNEGDAPRKDKGEKEPERAQM